MKDCNSNNATSTWSSALRPHQPLLVLRVQAAQPGVFLHLPISLNRILSKLPISLNRSLSKQRLFDDLRILAGVLVDIVLVSNGLSIMPVQNSAGQSATVRAEKKSKMLRFKGELTKHGAKTGILTWRELLSRRLVFSGGSTVAGSILSLFPEEQ